MESFALDLSLEIIQGSTHNLGQLTLWCRLRANTYNPLQPRPHVISVSRTNEEWTPVVHEPVVSPVAVANLVRQLHTLGWPGRNLAVSASDSSIAGWQEVRFRVALNSQESELRLVLAYRGLTGADAESIRTIFRTVVDLAGLPKQEEWISGTSSH